MRSGFLTIIGPANAGKSTLLNKLLKTNLNIVSSKPQTTRNNIAGILTDHKRGIQLVITDTPGILKKNVSILDARLQDSIVKAVEDADIILFLLPAKDSVSNYLDFFEKLKGKKVIICFNKIDLGKPSLIETEKKLEFPMIEISALKELNIDSLFKIIDPLITDEAQYYPDDVISDRTERFFVKEYIREGILENLKEEIPHQIFVDIDTMEEQAEIWRIEGTVYTERENHKKIIIGSAGSMIKKIGTEARKKSEELLSKKVFLKLEVKVKENWRNDPIFLKKLEYY